MVTGPKPATVTLTFEGPREITDALELRAVGFIKQKKIGYVLDPILKARPAGIPAKPWRCIRNYESIRDLPTVTATPTDPVVLWITADTRNLRAGRHCVSLRVASAAGRAKTFTVRVFVGDV